MRILDSRVV